MDKAPDAYRTISEVAEDLGLPQHVLRFWETRFGQIKPLKRGGGRRYYRPDDVLLLRGIQHLLYREGYTIKGVQRILKEQGVKGVQRFAPGAGWSDEAPAHRTAPQPAERADFGFREPVAPLPDAFEGEESPLDDWTPDGPEADAVMPSGRAPGPAEARPMAAPAQPPLAPTLFDAPPARMAPPAAKDPSRVANFRGGVSAAAAVPSEAPAAVAPGPVSLDLAGILAELEACQAILKAATARRRLGSTTAG